MTLTRGYWGGRQRLIYCQSYCRSHILFLFLPLPILKYWVVLYYQRSTNVYLLCQCMTFTPVIHLFMHSFSLSFYIAAKYQPVSRWAVLHEERYECDDGSYHKRKNKTKTENIYLLFVNIEFDQYKTLIVVMRTELNCCPSA